MAKDPAFLFYPNDWLGGTMTLSRHQKGCYIDLLVAQFNSGPLSLDTIKTVLGQDQASWTVLSGKFKQTAEGLWYNERLIAEKSKREEFSNKQKERVNKRWYKSGIDSGNTAVLPKIENEIVNENEIKNDFVNKDFNRKTEFLTNLKWKEEFCMAKNLKMLALEKLQQEFISDTDLKGEFVDSYKRYFTNWFNKKQNGTHQQSHAKSANRKSAGAEQLLDSLKNDIASLRPGS